RFVALQPERDRKCMDSQFAHGVFNRLHAWLIGECRESVLFGVVRLGGIKRASVAAGHSGSRAEVAMNLKELFGTGIKGLHVGVRNRPCGRYAALVPDDAKIFRAHSE